MKKLITVGMIFLATIAHAQTWKEWTQQKKTQIKYLVDQIAALKVYAVYVEKGYGIAKKGLNAIHSIKKGDFSLHEEYFNSLKTINPGIKNYWKVADIIALQIKIVKSYQKQRKLIRESRQFTQGEISYYNAVFNNLLNGCTNITEQLISIETAGKMEMKDDERLKKIDALHADMLDKYLFAERFTNEALGLQINRLRDANDVNTSRSLLGLSK